MIFCIGVNFLVCVVVLVLVLDWWLIVVISGYRFLMIVSFFLGVLVVGIGIFFIV